MSKRIVVNLLFFAAIGISLTVWALTTVVSFDFIERPYRVTTEFSTSPGLSPHFEVTYLGQKVGAISSVKLGDRLVTVELEIDRGVKLPAQVDASVRRKSAVGEPYVDLTPSAGIDPSAGERLADGDLIPLERTSTPLAYSELFLALDELVSVVPPDALETLLHELAVGLDGRSESLRNLLLSADSVSANLAANVDLLDAFLIELTRLTHTFATHRESVTGAVDDLAALSATLAQADANITALLEDGTTFTSRLAELLAVTKGDLTCTVDGLGTLASRLSPETVAALEHVIGLSPEFLFVLEGIRDPDGFSRGTLGFSSGQNLPPVYPEPLEKPLVPEISPCPPLAAATGGTDAAAPPGSTGSPVAPPGAAGTIDDAAPSGPGAGEPSEADRTRGPGADTGRAARWLILLAVVALAAVWRWLFVVRRRGGSAVS